MSHIVTPFNFDFPDNHGNHYMSTLIQTTQTNVPVVLMYRLIHLTGADESAPALRDALKKQLEEDQIYDLVKANLVGLITDGAPSMIGEFTGFIQIVTY